MTTHHRIALDEWQLPLWRPRAADERSAVSAADLRRFVTTSSLPAGPIARGRWWAVRFYCGNDVDRSLRNAFPELQSC